jgi:chromosome segregation ATPase
MVFLFVLAALLIGANVIAALVSGSELNSLKTELAQVNQVRQKMQQKLAEAESVTQNTEGQRDLLNGEKARKQERIQQLSEELEELKADVVPEHAIETNDPVEDKSIGLDDASEEGQAAGRKIKTRMSLGR